MEYALITAGIACLIAAIVGGGLKAFGIEIPQFASVRRQMLLGALGMLLLGLGLWVRPGGQAPPPDARPGGQAPAPDAPQNEVQSNSTTPTEAPPCEGGDAAFDLNARIVSFVHGLESPTPAADLTARTQALQQVGLVLGIDATTMVSVTPAELSTLIRRRLEAGLDERCAASDLRGLIDQIESRTGRGVP
jgi:hypothetical protein